MQCSSSRLRLRLIHSAACHSAEQGSPASVPPHIVPALLTWAAPQAARRSFVTTTRLSLPRRAAASTGTASRSVGGLSTANTIIGDSEHIKRERDAKSRNHQRKTQRPYRFPLTRALEHLRGGYRYHQSGSNNTDAREEAVCSVNARDGTASPMGEEPPALASQTRPTGSPETSPPPPPTKRVLSTFGVLWEGVWQLMGQPNNLPHEETSLLQGHHSEADLTRDEVGAALTREGTVGAAKEEHDRADAFFKYHCHHLYVSFKRDRTKWSRESSNAVEAARFSALTDYIFHASLLLHISALYGIGDDRVEALLEVCLSASVFVSQNLNNQRHEQATQNGGRRGQARGQKRALTQSRSSSPPLYAGSHDDDWRCLLRAAFHFTEGVRLWDLCTTQVPLFAPNTHTVFSKLLQAHAGSLLDACTQCHLRLDSSQRQHLAALLAGQKRQSATHALDDWFCTSRSAVPRQARSLHVLPLFWISSTVDALANMDRASRHGNSAPRDGIRAAHDPWQLTWQAARFAFVHTVALFDDGTRRAGPQLDITSWVLCALLYNQSRTVCQRHLATASTEEVMLLLSVLTSPSACLAPLAAPLDDDALSVPGLNTVAETEPVRRFLDAWLASRDVDARLARTATRQTARAAALSAMTSACPPPLQSVLSGFHAVQRLPAFCVSLALGSLEEEQQEDLVNGVVLSSPAALAAYSLVRDVLLSICVRWPAWRPLRVTDDQGAPVPLDSMNRQLHVLLRTSEAGASAARHVCRLRRRVQRRQAVLEQISKSLDAQMEAGTPSLTGVVSRARVSSASTTHTGHARRTATDIIRERRHGLRLREQRAASLDRWLQSLAELLAHTQAQLQRDVRAVEAYVDAATRNHAGDGIPTTPAHLTRLNAEVQIHLQCMHAQLGSTSLQSPIN